MKNIEPFTPTTLIAKPADGLRTLFLNWRLNGWGLATMALAAAWLLCFNELRGEWQINPQYNYGYVVPLLSLALFWRRWPERPQPSPASSGFAGLSAIGALALLLPLRVIAEANPEWRLVFWVHASLTLALTLCLVYRAGGWRWVIYFAPPVVFVLIAVPWPTGIERAIIQNLMRLVALCTVQLLDLLNIPALAQGNLIQVGAGTVGIDEACSGVRSLQSGLMLSLFLGEMHRLSMKRRIGLVAVSFFVVMAANVTRTTFLTWTAATHGLHKMESLHDAAGILVMCIVLPGLMGLAHVFRSKTKSTLITPTITRAPLTSLPRWIGLAAIAWLACCELTTEVWYHVRERELLVNPQWSVNWPSHSPHFVKTSLPKNSLAMLRCSDSESATWEDTQGDQWSGFVLRWKPGRNSAQLAKGHRPEICFPAAGAKLVDVLDPVSVEVRGIRLQFRHQIFAVGPGFFHVFYCLWSDRVALHEREVIEDGSQLSRLLAVAAGKRNLGQQVLELVVSGPESSDAALALFKAELGALIVPDSAPISLTTSTP